LTSARRRPPRAARSRSSTPTTSPSATWTFARGDLRLALVKSGYLLGRDHPEAGADRLRDALYEGFDADVPETLEDCYRAAAVASEVRGFDVWWDDDEADERAVELRATVEGLR
jgi:hypothetical protein